MLLGDTGQVLARPNYSWLRVLYACFLATAPVILPGCVSIHPEAAREKVDKAATLALSGEFENQASYRSPGQFRAHGDLAALLGLQVLYTAYVQIQYQPEHSLTMTWFWHSKLVASRTFTKEQGLKVAEDGSIELPAQSKWDAGEGGAAYGRRRVRLFINDKGDLATIQTGGAVGFISILPGGIYTEHLAIFPRKQ